jgi:hypothetical protein
MNNKVEQDIWNWITEYVEIENEFYNYKFPPCPYAKSARLKGLVDVIAYDSGSPFKFIKYQVTNLIEHKKFNIKVMAFPIRMRWYFHLHFMINRLNKYLVLQDFYIQYGKTDEYFVVIANKLSDVIEGHTSLLKTDYYKNWSSRHYNNVVDRRKKHIEIKGRHVEL